MRCNRSALFVAPVVLFATISGRADDKPVTLAHIFKKSSIVRMKIDTTVKANGTDVLVSLASKATVKEIKANGQIVIESQDEAGNVNVNGSDMDIPPGAVTTLTYDKSGKLVDLKADAGGIVTLETLRQLEILRMPIFTAKEVKPGDAWQTEFDNPAVKGKKFTVKTVYTRTENVGGVDLWNIKQSGEPETDSSGAKMVFDGTFWIDPATEQIVKAEISIKGEPTIMFGLQTLVTKVKRIQTDAK